MKYLNLSFFFIQAQFLLPVMLLFYFENGLTVQDYLLFQSITYILYMFFSVPVGYISDHISKKYVLIIGYLLNIGRLFLYLFLRGYAVILIGEILMTFVRFFVIGIADSYIFEYLKERKQESKMLNFTGTALSFMSFGVAVGSLFGPMIYRFWGFEVLLLIEFLFSTIGIFILFRFPKTKIYNKQGHTLKDLKAACSVLWKNQNIRWLIIYNILLYSATTIFVSTFQPLMKLSLVPVILFGGIYFSNHMIRGISSRLTRKFVSFLGLRKLLIAGLGSSVFGFLLMLLAFEVKNPCFTVVSLICICFVIGLQLINQISNVNEIHQATYSHIRATGISIYNMSYRGLGGIMLCLFQKISSGFNAGNHGYLIFAIIFALILGTLFCSKSRRALFQKSS